MNFDFKTFSDKMTNPFTKTTQQHLKNTYLQLSQMMAISAVVSYLNISYGILSVFADWSFFGVLICLLWFMFTPYTNSNDNKRKYILFGLSAFKVF